MNRKDKFIISGRKQIDKITTRTQWEIMKIIMNVDMIELAMLNASANEAKSEVK